MGKWLDVNGEASYGSRAWPEAPRIEQVRFTQKDEAVYAISLSWPGQELAIPVGEEPADASVTLLDHDEELAWRYADGRLRIEVPTLSVDEVPSRHAHVFKVQGL